MGKPCTTTVIRLDLLQESTTTGPKTHANAAGANIDLPQESTTTGPKTHSNAAEAIIDLPQESTTTGPRTPPTAAGESGETGYLAHTPPRRSPEHSLCNSYRNR